MPLRAQTQIADLTGGGQFVPLPGQLAILMGVDDSYAVSATGNFTGPFSLERSLDGGTTWGIMDTSNGPAEWGGHVSSGCLLRAGFEPGAQVSGTAHVIFKVGQ